MKKKDGEQKTFKDADLECIEHIKIFKEIGWNAILTKEAFGRNFNTKRDLKYGDIIIWLPEGMVFVDAKRRGYVSLNSAENFDGMYYYFYWPDEDCIEFAPAESVKKYIAKVKSENKLITLPHSGEPGYKFKPGQLYTALTLEQMIEYQKQYE